MKVSVIMPTYNQCGFIRRALLSLTKQTYTDWELILVNDGCTDETEAFIADYLKDKRIHYIKNSQNTGLGHALNQGLDAAGGELIAYLPSDDYWFESHLETVCRKFEEEGDGLFLVYTGMQFDTNDTLFYTPNTEAKGQRKGYSLQLVQTMHRRTNTRWTERNEWVTEDLFSMFWYKLTAYGTFGKTEQVTCHWTSHPFQRHKLIGEKFGGGLNRYRSHYQIHSPIRMQVSRYKFIDEIKLYENFRKRQKLCDSPLKILIVGELAYNPERIYALEEAGHRLYGLWTPAPSFSFSTVGPLPFGHVEDVPFSEWRQRIKEIAPDVIYGTLNFGAVSLAYDVMRAYPDIPFVWHFKEGPSVCLRNGNWDKLIYLYNHAAGKIFLNDTVRRWFGQFLPPTSTPTLIMDGDLPKKEYFKDSFSTKLSAKDGAVHTLVAGRMIGISNNDLRLLARNNIHIHLYTENYHASREKSTMEHMRVAPQHFHVHSHISADCWTEEFSKYDAGWLHCFHSHNGGNLLKATWDDLNIPARINTYAAAGLPVIFPDNTGHTVATQELAENLGIGIFFKGYQQLADALKDTEYMQKLSTNMLRQRALFSFDHYVPRLVDLFREAIKSHNKH